MEKEILVTVRVAYIIIQERYAVQCCVACEEKMQDCKEKKENEFDKIFEENIDCRPKDSWLIFLQSL